MSPLADLPLAVDLDGTLTPTDTLVESVLRLLKQQPWALVLVLWWLCMGRSRFKDRVARRVDLQARLLPWRTDLVAWLRAERARGRRLILATAAHESIARKVQGELQLFDDVLASTAEVNLRSGTKLAAIRERLGADFVYAGDSSADLPIWREAAGAVLVGASESVARQARASTQVEREFTADAASPGVWLKALRVHQWSKNLLVFVPILAGFAIADADRLLAAAAAFLAFSLAASATYVMNDLWDLESDRQHARKRLRPFASGALPIVRGVAVAGGLLLAALALASALRPAFVAMLLGYVVLTTLYSLVLKRYVLIDVLVLALLYTYRVVAGSIATAIAITPWLLAFSVFTFLSLALVKRCAELLPLQDHDAGAAHGRDYRASDLVVLWPLGLGSALSAVVVFGLYIGTPSAAANYGSPDLLWGVGICLVYWFGRMWIKTSRGEMHDDPIVFAARDRGSRLTVGVMLGTVLAAHFWR